MKVGELVKKRIRYITDFFTSVFFIVADFEIILNWKEYLDSNAKLGEVLFFFVILTCGCVFCLVEDLKERWNEEVD